MVTLHEVTTFLVRTQIRISSLQTDNVNRCGRCRHLSRKLSIRRKRSSPNVFEMAATETITSIILIKLIRVRLQRDQPGGQGLDSRPQPRADDRSVQGCWGHLRLLRGGDLPDPACDQV